MRALLLLLVLSCGLAAANSVFNLDDFVFESEESPDRDLDASDRGYGEGRALLGASYPATDTVQVGIVEVAATSKLRCADFWRQSAPRGSTGPNEAYRLAMKSIVREIAEDMELPHPKLTLKMFQIGCKNPPVPGTPGGARRLQATRSVITKRLRAFIRIRLLTRKMPTFLEKMQQKYDDGSYTAAINANLPDQYQLWTPIRFTYKNGASPVCNPSAFDSTCAGESWNPDNVNLEQLG